jgi:hypothetical protein
MSEQQHPDGLIRSCAPLFISDHFLAVGIDARTTSATATFVKFEGRLFVVTCRHVADIAYQADRSTAQLFGASTIISLGMLSPRGVSGSLRGAPPGIDISLCPLPDYLFQQISKKSGKTPIDLDAWEEPTWPAVRSLVAVGFPDRKKRDGAGTIVSPLMEVHGEPCSALGPSHSNFALHARLDAPFSDGLSGMSGGPIFAVEGQRLLPLGIIFRGRPSGEEDDAAHPSDAIFDERDILIRGHLLTPKNFAHWLKAANATPPRVPPPGRTLTQADIDAWEARTGNRRSS